MGMGMMPKVAIVAALQREVKPLLKDSALRLYQHEGQWSRFFENDRAVIACAGIGAEHARRAATQIVEQIRPRLLVSAGFAGATNDELRTGDIFIPGIVMDAATGRKYATAASHETVLVSSTEIQTAAAKQELSLRFQAEAVDMEAAAVAEVALQHGVPFLAIKVIFDEAMDRLPPLQSFVRDGEFRTGRFIIWAGLRPWWWSSVQRLSRASSEASQRLCVALSMLVLSDHWSPQSVGELEHSFPR